MGPVASPVRRAAAADVPAVVTLHEQRIADGFLVTLGPRFLARLYQRVLRSPDDILLVAGPPGRVDGYVAVATDTARFYRSFVRHDAVPAALAAAPALLRHPRRAWETFRYGTGGSGEHHDLPAAEILSVAVASDATGAGVGGSLLRAALAELEGRGITSVQVVTAIDNERHAA